MSRYIDADKLVNRLPDDLPYKSSVKRVLIQAPTANDYYEKVAEMSYQSPIEVIIGQMRFEQEKRLEGEVFKAIQDVGVTVDKDELIKALQYDRDQYCRGFTDGCRGDIDKMCQEVKADTIQKMKERLAMRFGTYTEKDFTPIVELFMLIDRIAEEIIEGETK